MRQLIIGYAMNPSLMGVTAEDVTLLTHVNLAFGLVKDGLLSMDMLPDIAVIRQWKKWNPELQIVLSVGGWGAGGFSTMAMTEKGRIAFAQSCLKVLRQYDLDGVDIDWEYPCSDLAEIDCDPADKENFTRLLQTLRDVLGEKYILSIAAGASEDYIRDTQMDRVAEIVDYVMLMTYDMRSGFTPQAGHHAALGASRGDTTKTNTRAVVELFHEAGVPYEKMIVGAAFYSRLFTDVVNQNNGLLQKASVGFAGPTYGELTEQFLRENGYREYWDKEAQAAYLWNGSTFISYESPEAVRCKARYAREKGLLGIMYWEHGGDPGRVLLKAIAGVTAQAKDCT